MKPLFLQMSSDNKHYQGMIEDHQERHLAYCKKWDYEYCEYPAAKDLDGGWFCMEAILDKLKTGKYSHVFWIDADTFVTDFDHDMRETLPGWAYLAMTQHPFPWRDQPVVTINAGVMYWKCNQMAIELIDTLLKNKDRYADNQTGINRMLFGDEEGGYWQQGFRVLNNHWNNNMHDQPSPNPVVAAFHGCLEAAPRRILMQNMAKRFPYV